MSRLEIPVQAKVLWSTGDIKLWVDVGLRLRDSTGGWHDETFRADTATDLTTMAAYDAHQLGLPLPHHATVGVVHAQTGLAIRSGYLRFQVLGMDATEYVVSCLFLGDPTTAPTGLPGKLPRNLVQPLALLDRLQFAMKDDPTGHAPHGVFVSERR